MPDGQGIDGHESYLVRTAGEAQDGALTPTSTGA
jgi:hypothetical protein